MVVGLSGRLPAPSPSFMEWAVRAWHITGKYEKSGKVWCQVCGHVSEADRHALAVALKMDNDYICPGCGHDIELEAYGGRMAKEYAYGKMVGMVTMFRGIMVARVFDVIRNVSRGGARQEVRETYQIWTFDDGGEVILSRDYFRSPFSLTWRYDSVMGVRRHNASAKGSWAFGDMFDGGGVEWYPRAAVPRLVRRNGFTSAVMRHGLNAYDVIRRIMSQPVAEEMLKHGQWDVLRWLGHRVTDEVPHIHSVRICIRNGYEIPDFSDWLDMVRILEELGRDVMSPTYLCPDDLSAAHDRWMRLAQRKRLQRKKEEQRKEIAQAEGRYRNTHAAFIGIWFVGDGFMAHVLRSVAEFLEEGEAMKHCVFDNRYYEKESVILSIRDEASGERLETAEISTKTWKVLQCRGRGNGKTERHARILDFLHSNMGKLMVANGGK